MYDIQEATNQLLDVNFHEIQRSIQVTESGLRVNMSISKVTVPTGFEQTGADEVRKKFRSSCKISRDQARYILTFQWKYGKLTPVSRKKKRCKKINQNSCKRKKDNGQGDKIVERVVKKEFTNNALSSKEEIDSQVLKFRVTRNRVEEKHCFTALETTRDLGGTVQDYFKWKADMTNFDTSLHQRNITHFGFATLRSSLAYGMLQFSSPHPTDIIVDLMYGRETKQ
ncbi:hypothetical protein EI555_014421 [Monodon monoceros]|uniref:Uncharacterized protein n=1 Tax=Monodon monoceros TaxID=40151 RepID=A0A4U1EM01_MONMO|nr:hypothetical protein EI555_014421 [Monodon monoceros]